MFCAFALVFLSLHPFCCVRSVAVYPSAQENPPWFLACVNASDSSSLRLYAPKGARDPEPVPCSASCLDEGYKVAALTFESCYCGNHLQHGLVFSECFNASSNGGSDVRGDGKRQSVPFFPVGAPHGIFALYRSDGPFLHSLSLSTSSDRVQTGKSFVVEVSGNLAGSPNQPTGIQGLAEQDLSHVTVQFLDTTLKGQRSDRVSVLEDGSFFVSSDWILDTPGNYEINVSVSHLFSTLSSTLHLSISQPSPDGLVISLLHGPLGVPSCLQLEQITSHAAYLGDPVTLQAHVGEGLATEFCWWFDHKNRNENKEEEERKCVKTTCFHNFDGLSSTLTWTFETEGIYTVTVNASSVTGWTQQTISIVIVPVVVSDLKVRVTRNHVRAGESISVDVELVTTMKHLLVLNLTLNDHKDRDSANFSINVKDMSEGNANHNSCRTDSSHMKMNLRNDDTSVFTNEMNDLICANSTNINETENHTNTCFHWEHSNRHSCNYSSHGNMDCDLNISQNHSNIYCHDDTDSNPHPVNPLHVLHPSNRSSCCLHLHLHCHLSLKPGQYHLKASVSTATRPSSTLLSTVLPQALMVYEPICALRPSGSWMSTVATHTGFSLEVVGRGGRVGTRIMWTFVLHNAVVMNRTTEEWNIHVSLPLAGCYSVTIKAFNPVSWTTFQTHILVQDVVGELVLSVPRGSGTNQKQNVLFSVSSGSNVTVSLLANATLLYRSSSYVAGEEATVVLLFNRTGTVVVELQAENKVSSQNKSVRVCVEGNRKLSSRVRANPNWQPSTTQSPVHIPVKNAVWIYAAETAYPTNTDITFLAVADASDIVEFFWHFGDSTSAKTASKNVTKRYHKPGRFDVVVWMLAGQTSITSKAFPLVVQRAVKLNRLVHQASVLHNQTVSMSCRVNVGTDLVFSWSFGDGSSRLGGSTEQHVFYRAGEFRVKVTVSNMVSSASLSSHIFVVDRPCQPPPVKNMGPLKLQVQRYEDISLGVTFETDIECDISGGLQYNWTLFDSAGQALHLPLADKQSQSLTLQSHLLQYDTYTAIARVQVIGSVVYSNYSVSIQVMSSPPVAFIQGGTNIFINKGNTTVITLDGQRSYDPDFPMNPLSFSWTCKPLSSITTSCFSRQVSTSSPALTFPASFLKPNFDQFLFTLTIQSGERSASSETFITVTTNLLGKVLVYCPHCQGDQVNWDHSFSVSTLCEDCGVFPQHIQYTWSLYLVNASSKPVTEVPFCYTVDLSAPSTIIQGPGISAPGASSLKPSDTETSLYTRTVHASAPPFLTEIAPENRVRKQNLGHTDSGTLSQQRRSMATKAGEEPFYDSLEQIDSLDHQSSTEYTSLPLDNSGILSSKHFGQSSIINEFPIDSVSSAEWEFSFPVLGSGDMEDYDVPFPSAEEGDPGSSTGRPTGADGDTLSPGEDSSFDPVHKGEGSNLLVSRPSEATPKQTLLDLPRDPVDGELFESYTYTGISSRVLSVRPFTLRPGGRYMLEVTAKSRSGFVGRTQLFLKAKPAPKGVRCQVQPVTGMELHTHFSIFCTSGKEDLLYEYSFSVGDAPPRVLYRGRDFQYYFNLPSGDPSDDYKVTIYTEISSSTYRTATKPCPVTVQVQPSFLRDTSSHGDPDLELSRAGLRNLSALVALGNSREIRNYISLLSSTLNRLSLDTKANTHIQRHTRNVLICTVCKLKKGEQASMLDSVSTLKKLSQVTNQVSSASSRHVTVYVQAISNLFLESSGSLRYHLDYKTLSSLVVLLSHNLQSALTQHDLPNMGHFTQVSESEQLTGENICKPDSPTSDHTKQGQSLSTKQKTRLVVDILQTASDLMLKYIWFNKVQQHRVGTGVIALHAANLNQTSTIISSGSTTFYVPASLIQLLFVHRIGASESGKQKPCVLTVLTELDLNPYTHYLAQLGGPVVDLSLYKCSTRRKIPVRSLVSPIDIELQHPPSNMSSVREYVLLRTQVSYHSFNITHEHLQQAIQLSVVFTPPPDEVFPIMLLFRMFERPTPSMHHLQTIHHWESNAVRITLPPSYLNAAGVGHLALLNADFGKAPRHKQLREEISYSLTVVGSQCLSWDSHRVAWTHRGCRPRQTDAAPAVNCSCHQLRPVTVVQQQIHSSHDTADLGPFISVSHDLTVLCVLVLCVCLYITGLVVCKKADDLSEKNRSVHYLSDNSLLDPYLYAVTIHTGLCSAANMSAKVYIVLYGEDGFSPTKELQVQGCSLFRRNFKDTFILSAAESVGPVWGVHIWHDCSGPSPDWYLKRVEVSEVTRGHVKGRAWLFVAQCWLAVDKGDGQVERMLRACTQGMGFAKMLSFKLSNFLADFHIWMSVHSCPGPSLFTRTQRLSVCLLLLLGYACVNAVIISQMDDQLPFEFGILDLSAVSVTTGVLSVLAVLPGASMVSFLFRLQEVEVTRPRGQREKDRNTYKDCHDAPSVKDSVFHLSWTSLKQWIREAWRKKYQGTDLLSVSVMMPENTDTNEEPVNQQDVSVRKRDGLALESSSGPALRKLPVISEDADQAIEANELDLSSESSMFCGTHKDLLHSMRDEPQTLQNRKSNGRRVGPASQCFRYLAWALCLLLSLSCLTISAMLGMRFSSSKVLLWIHSLFFSLTSCIFFIHPAVILTAAATVSFWYRHRADFHTFSGIKEFEMQLCSCDGAYQPEEQLRPSGYPQGTVSYDKLLADRRRARYLRFVRPPTPTELRRTRGGKRRETLIYNTLRDFSICVSMVFLMLCVTYGCSFSDHYHGNKAVGKQFIRNSDDDGFMSIQKQEDWWKWTQTSLLNLLYKNASGGTEQSHILIGELVLWKMEASSLIQERDFSMTLVPEYLQSFLSGRKSTYPHSTASSTRWCDGVGCNPGMSATVGLGHTKSDAASKLKVLHSAGWVDRQTVALRVQFTLFCPAANLFTSVTLLTQRSPTGGLLPSFKVHSSRLYQTPTLGNYVVMLCQLIFLILSLLELCLQVCTMRQQGLMGYWRTPCNWLEVSLLTVTLVHYVYYICHSIILMDTVEQLHRHRGHVDVSVLASWEQDIRTLRGLTLFLVMLKCVTVLRVNRTMAFSATLFTRSLSSLFWPTVNYIKGQLHMLQKLSGLILLVALSCAGNLLFVQSSLAFSSIPSSFQTLLRHYWGLRPASNLFLSGREFLYFGTLYLSSTVVWRATVIGVMSSLVRRSENRKDVFTAAQLANYIGRRLSVFAGQREPKCSENHVESRCYYLEEFESVIDELLCRLDALSNCLPTKNHHYIEEESPITSPLQEPPIMQTPDFVRTQITEETIRSKIEPEILQFLQPRKKRNNPSSDILVVSDNLRQTGTRDEENPNDRALPIYSKGRNCTSLPESASLIRIWTENVLEKQADQGTKINDSCRLHRPQAIHTELVVEVLVHEEHGAVEPDKVDGPTQLFNV